MSTSDVTHAKDTVGFAILHRQNAEVYRVAQLLEMQIQPFPWVVVIDVESATLQLKSVKLDRDLDARTAVLIDIARKVEGDGIDKQ